MKINCVDNFRLNISVSKLENASKKTVTFLSSKWTGKVKYVFVSSLPDFCLNLVIVGISHEPTYK